ncbi:MAG: site-2 protease family protein [Oscillospiraceae bacterium]
MTNPIERIKGPIFELFDYFAGRTDIATVIISFFAVAVIIFVVFPIHECAHGFVAKLLGDDTAEHEGRLSLNPFQHIDPMGALCMCLCCIGWAKPVPVNIYRCRKVKARTALALTSLAGPLANILLSYIFIIILKVMLLFGIGSTTMLYVMIAISYTAEINIYLAVFNLIPVPPFDGSKILMSFLPNKALMNYERIGRILYWVFFGALLIGFLDIPLNFLTNCIWQLLDWASFFIPTI